MNISRGFSSFLRGRGSLFNIRSSPAHFLNAHKAGGSSKARPFSSKVQAGGGDGGKGGSGGNGGGGGGGGDDSSSSGGGPWGAYMRLLELYPIRTKAITTALLNGAGDLLAQFLIEKDSAYDPKRTLIFTLLGGVLVGPALTWWYSTLGKIVTMTGTAGTMGRLVLDQFAFAPVFIGVFFCSLLTVTGQPQDIPKKLQQDWWDAVVVNWKIWIPAQAVNFAFVPPTLQVLFANVVALAWNTYLSWQSNKKLAAAPPPPPAAPAKEDKKKKK